MTTEHRREPARLREIKLDELSLVDRPANPLAKITLFKRDAGKHEEDNMRIEKHERPRGYATLEDAISAIADAEGCPRHEAMEKAADRYPSLIQKYRSEEPDAATTAKAAADPDLPKERFDALTDTIQKRDRCTRHVAMERAAAEAPDLLAAFQELKAR